MKTLRVEEDDNIDRQIKQIKMYIRMSQHQGDITLVDQKYWIFTIPVKTVRPGFCIGMFEHEEPSRVYRVFYPPKRQNWLEHLQSYRYIQFHDEQPHLYHNEKRIWFYPEHSKLSQAKRQLYYKNFKEKRWLISVDIQRRKQEEFFLKIEKLNLKEQRRQVTGGCIRIHFRMPFWEDSTLFETERRARHATKTNVGAPKLCSINHERLETHFRSKYLTRVSDVEVAQALHARQQYGGSSIRRQATSH